MLTNPVTQATSTVCSLNAFILALLEPALSHLKDENLISGKNSSL